MILESSRLKRAHLILLQQNPLKDVANACKIRGIITSGQWYGQKAIEEMLGQ
jgi:hypothetical protein